MALTQNSLGYLVVEGEDGQFRGASLVVDFRGIPLDFRYTDPIRPTRLERILYGNALDVYLREELILQSLLGAVEFPPALWVCNDETLIAPLSSLAKGKVTALSPSKRAPLDVAGAVESTAEDGVIFLQADSVSAPLRLIFPAGVRSDEVQQVSNMLVEAAQTMELLEPFGRIQKALTSLRED